MKVQKPGRMFEIAERNLMDGRSCCRIDNWDDNFER
jgi:hypothetical protein